MNLSEDLKNFQQKIPETMRDAKIIKMKAENIFTLMLLSYNYTCLCFRIIHNISFYIFFILNSFKHFEMKWMKLIKKFVSKC